MNNGTLLRQDDSYKSADGRSGERFWSSSFGQRDGRWYVVQTQPSREAGAAMQLRAQGFEPFLPMIRKAVRRRARLHNVIAPLFPRYLFVPLAASQNGWRAINGTFGVVRLVSFGDRPQPTPVGLVENMLALAGDDGVLDLSRDLQIGQSVRLVAGPFANAIGECERLDGNGRVRVLLGIMGGRVAVSVDREDLLAI